MSRPRTVAAAAILWCVVVAAVASLVWVVIDRAGQGVVPMSQSEIEPSGTPSVGQPPAPSATTPSGPGSHHSTGAGTSPPTSTPATPPASPTRPQSVAVRRASWSGTAGHLVAQCRGLDGSLVSAYPNAGWRYAIDARGPRVVRVQYSRLGEDKTITVSAQCAEGTPQFTVSSGVPGED